MPAVIEQSDVITNREEAALAVPNHSEIPAAKFFIESYGCAMNFADSEVIASILTNTGYKMANRAQESDIIFINTCSIREKAEQTVRNRLAEFKSLKKQRPGLLVGVLGCMAERLKSKFLEEEKLVDMVVGPDAYRSLPQLIAEAESGQKGVNVLLSREETYGDISPVRLNSNGVTAFVSIMRGCNNMCTFCVVPFTRGRERSRDPYSIEKECAQLFEDGYREVTLLGQNVDSYCWQQHNATTSFAALLERVARISPLLRVRFSTSHPKDITDEVLYSIARHDNICNYIHLPVQSGSSRILKLMNRTYSREWYLSRIDRINELIPGCGISTDTISGFCLETEEDHLETLSLMECCKFELAYMYYYSERPGTLAERKLTDDVPLQVKKRRLQEVVDLHRKHSLSGMQKEIGKTHRVLIEGDSRKSQESWAGRSDNNKMVVFPKKGIYAKGDYANVYIESCTAGTLIGSSIES
ncbi:tRNA (N6-isopentenyl adenosine(37)-C2)-methylthiotransferase MiaB [soil metagenome]